MNFSLERGHTLATKKPTTIEFRQHEGVLDPEIINVSGTSSHRWKYQKQAAFILEVVSLLRLAEVLRILLNKSSSSTLTEWPDSGGLHF